MKQHVILVGLPGSGKTTVGRLAATRWTTPFTDTDERIERETGRSVAAVFQQSGEAEFRRLERAAMDNALGEPPHLIAAGGGWMAQTGNLEAARARGAFVVYLRVSPGTAACRLEGENARPLLAGPDRLARLFELLTGRREWYDQADAVVDASGSIEEVAQALSVIVLDRGRA